jgi:tetratricopeptide (TPR) repeat protein
MGPPFWNVPHPRNPAFTGRDDVLADLRNRLIKPGRTAPAEVVTGLGGIGKTQTAVEYAYRYRDQYEAVLWLNAESVLALKAGCGELARRMQLPHPEDDLDQAVLAVKDWLETHSGWLLVLDNADDPAILTPFLPDAEHGHILITSRAQDFQDLGILDPVGLPKLPAEDATAFLLLRCGRQGAEAGEQAAAEQLARELDGLPLALEQAAAYVVASPGAAFQSYLNDYRCRGLGRLEARRPALGRYPRSVVSTWTANFDAVQAESRAAAEVLQLSAFLAPDSIPFELLSRGALQLGPTVRQALAGGRSRAEAAPTGGMRSGPRARFLSLIRWVGRLSGLRRLQSQGTQPAEAEGSPLLVRDLLRPLSRFSLICINGPDEMYGIHRLVQEVLKAAMDDDARRLWAERTVRAVNQAFPPVEYDNWPLCGRLLPHALVIGSQIQRDCLVSEEAGRLLNQTGSYLYERGQYAEAEPLYRRTVEVRRAALGERHPDYAESLNNAAILLGEMGRHAEAEPLYRQAMDIIRTALGKRHPRFAVSLNNLAALYSSMGRYAEAEPLYRRAVEVRRAALGERHPDYAAPLNNLAYLYHSTGRHAEAEPLYRQAMDIIRTALGERHPRFAVSLNNLAALYSSMGRHAEVEALFEQARAIRRPAPEEPDH